MIPFPDKKYNIIYADPAWKCWYGGKKNASNHYDCMDLQSIKDFPIQNITAENCILFMWVIFPLLPKCIETMEAWGFKYSTCGFTWVKKNKKADSFFWGCGYYTRANAELCLIGTKGNFKRKSKSVHQIVYEPIREHSRKPDCVRDRIIELCGDLPRIELFARRKVEGWDVWGNEVQ